MRPRLAAPALQRHGETNEEADSTDPSQCHGSVCKTAADMETKRNRRVELVLRCSAILNISILFIVVVLLQATIQQNCDSEILEERENIRKINKKR